MKEFEAGTGRGKQVGVQATAAGAFDMAGVIVDECKVAGSGSEGDGNVAEEGRVPFALAEVVAVEDPVEVGEEPVAAIETVEPVGLVTEDDDLQTGTAQLVDGIEQGRPQLEAIENGVGELGAVVRQPGAGAEERPEILLPALAGEVAGIVNRLGAGARDQLGVEPELAGQGLESVVETLAGENAAVVEQDMGDGWGGHGSNSGPGSGASETGAFDRETVKVRIIKDREGRGKPMRAVKFLLAAMVAVLMPLASVSGAAQAPPPPAKAPSPAAATSTPEFPGIAEVVPRLSQLTEDAGTVRARIAELEDRRSFEASLQQLREQQMALQQRLAQLGDPEAWSVERLLDIRSSLTDQRGSLGRLLAAISEPITELNQLRSTWEKHKTFWKNWEQALRKQGLALPQEAFVKARETVEPVLSRTDHAFSALVQLQTEVTNLQEQNRSDLNRVDARLDSLRRKTFSKTAPSFFNPAYYRQFGADLWHQALQGRSEGFGGVVAYARDQGWLLLTQICLTLLLGLFIRRQRGAPQVADEWRFILKHPWATGIFVAFAGLSFLYPAPPAYWRFPLWALVVGSASLLVAGLLENRRKIFLVFYLAGLFLLALALQTIILPQPLYRLYLAMVTLGSIPLLLILARRNRKAKEGKRDSFFLALQGGSLLFFLVFATQAGGYSVLSSRLFEASLETVFLWLMAAMAMRLMRGGVEFLFSRRLLLKSRFVRRSGAELAARLKGVFDTFVIGYACFYLLVVWGLFDSVAQAWGHLLGYGFHWGETFISVQMVLFAALVIYLSIVLSWILRALLEWEVFPRKGMDRGVRDSIKKLLHYSLIFVGLLLALSLAGIDLKNFAVLAGAFGIGIGFGLQNIVNNFVSGIILLFERPIKVGDMVVIEGEWGTVRKIGLRSTVVETIDQSEIIVPNSDLVSQKVTNWTLSTKVARVVLAVGVAYGSDLTKVLEILLEAAHQNDEALPDPAPSAIFVGFGDSSLDFELRVWIADIARRLVVRSDLGQYVDRRFREERVEIPFPQRDLHLRSVDGTLLERMDQPSAPRAKPDEPA